MLLSRWEGMDSRAHVDGRPRMGAVRALQEGRQRACGERLTGGGLADVVFLIQNQDMWEEV